MELHEQLPIPGMALFALTLETRSHAHSLPIYSSRCAPLEAWQR